MTPESPPGGRARQWEIWQARDRELLVITPDYRNDHWPTVMVVPVLSVSLGVPSPGMVELSDGRHAKCDVIATIGHGDLTEGPGRAGVVTGDDCNRVRRALRTTLDL